MWSVGSGCCGRDFGIMSINEKRKVMIVGRSDDKSNAVWIIQENELKQVQEYKYLEMWVSLNGCEKVKNKLGKPVGKSIEECSKDESK